MYCLPLMPVTGCAVVTANRSDVASTKCAIRILSKAVSMNTVDASVVARTMVPTESRFSKRTQLCTVYVGAPSAEGRFQISLVYSMHDF